MSILNVVGRIRIDNATNTFEKKYFASTNTTIAGANGQYAKMSGGGLGGCIIALALNNLDSFTSVPIDSCICNNQIS